MSTYRQKHENKVVCKLETIDLYAPSNKVHGQFVKRMDSINRQRSGRRMSDWMDNQDVCQVLKISPRNLQTLRDSGRLPHSKINNRIYYCPEDVARLIEDCNDV